MSTTTTTPTLDLGQIIDLDRYPIDQLDSPARAAAVQQARAGLRDVGCSRLEGFIRPDAHERLTAETTACAPDAFRNSQDITPYSDHGNDEYPADHPRRHTGRMTNGFVGKDLIPDDTLIRQLYDHDAFHTFVAECLEIDELHQFADPIRGLVINVMDDGTQMPWHYDANEFIVSLMTRNATAGGTFEYCPDLREPGDEHYDDVAKVLNGDRDRVRELNLRVGDLQIFRGRYSMHRVTPVEGTRHTVLFGFSEQPGYIGAVESTRMGYGRVLQEHIDAEQGHNDGLAG